MIRRMAATAALGLAAGALALAGPAQAAELTAEAAWEAIDTGAGGARLDSAHTQLADATNVHVVWRSGEPASELGTSFENPNLGVPVVAGSVVSVDYTLLNGASPAAGAVRLFAYDTANADTFNVAPTYQAVAPDDGSTSGTLRIDITGAATIGSVGVVYDTSNGGVEGTVRFSNLTVDEDLVLFVDPPAPEPTQPPEETEPPAGGEGGGADKEGLPATGAPLPILIGGGLALGLVGTGAVLLGRRRRSSMV